MIYSANLKAAFAQKQLTTDLRDLEGTRSRALEINDRAVPSSGRSRGHPT